MLNVAIYNNKINFLRTKRSRKGLSIYNHGTKKYDSLDVTINNVFRDLVNKDSGIVDRDLSCVIDSNLCSFNEVFLENESSLEFHNNLSGNSSLSNHINSYYYPIGVRGDHYMGVHIDKSIKERILNAVNENSCSLNSLGLGIFSAENLARYIFQAKTLDNYLILRFISSNALEILYINDGILMLYGQYRIIKKSLKPIKLVGDMKDKINITECLDKIIVKGNKKVGKIQKTFIYQSQGQSAFVKNLMKNNNSNHVLLNVFNYNGSSEYKANLSDTINHLSYAELGHVFRGMNV